MKLDDYMPFAQSEHNFSGTRIIVVPNADAAQRLKTFYTDKEQDCRRISLHDCIDAKMTFLPMPADVFSRLSVKIQEAGSLSIVSGIHAYLLLLDNQKREIAFAELKKLVDVSNSKIIVLIPAVWENDLKKMFDERYTPSKQLVYLDGNLETSNIEVVLVDNSRIDVQPPDCHSFREYLETIDDFPTHEDDKIVVALPDNNKKIAGLNDAVKQVHTLADCMRQFYGVDENLPENVLLWILDTARQLGIKNALNALQKVFFEGDLHDVLQTGPKKVIDEPDHVKRTALLWCLRQSVKPDSYIFSVISTQDSGGEYFLADYIAHAAVRLLQDKNAESFAEERRVALKEIDERRLAPIRLFVEQTKEKPLSQVSVWLNNDTPAEHEEFIGRFAESHVPSAYTKLEMYLADYDYGTEQLTNYFKRYRLFKLRNNVDNQFCQDAFTIQFSDVHSRESEMTKCFGSGAALLVVDAMGAEYLPLIVALAPTYLLKIESHCAVLSRYPTSTKFNPISGNCEKLPEIKALDNIVHYGVEHNQTKKYHENIAAVLDVVFPQIFGILAQNINRFERIILTADHGASRLAVLAHKLGFAKTLDNPSTDKPDDWRYVQTSQGKHCPDEFVETLDGKYWVVRGYNRLPKQGGKQFELHGGYTPEECLVPFVVFSKSAATTPPKAPQQQTKQQIVEKDDFDI